MGYTHYWVNKVQPGRRFTEEERAKLQAVLHYWQWEGIICRECTDPTFPYVLTDREIIFNGKGDDGHETFYFDLDQAGEEEGKYGIRAGFAFCKTAAKPYDQAVCEVLLTLKGILGDEIEVSSDGDMEGAEWKPAYDRLGIPQPRKAADLEADLAEARGNVVYQAALLVDAYREGRAYEGIFKTLSERVTEFDAAFDAFYGKTDPTLANKD